MSSDYTTHQNTYTARGAFLSVLVGLSIPTRQEPRKALYVSPLADPLIAASGPEEIMETSLKKKTFPAPHRLSMLS